MTWRTAIETNDTSGFQLFQTAYIDANGNIESFTSGTNRVDKYISNDYLSLKYILNVPNNYFYTFRSSSNTDFYKSKDGITYTEVTSDGNLDFAHEYLGKIGSRIYVTGFTGGSPKVFYSDDEGTTWSSFNATNYTNSRFVISNNGSAIYLAKYIGLLFKVTGTTWTQLSQPSSFNLTSVCHDGTRLIITGFNSSTYQREIHYSTNDGSSWTLTSDNIDPDQYIPSDLKYYNGEYYLLTFDSFGYVNEIFKSSSITSPSWTSIVGNIGLANNPDGKILAIISPTKILTSESETGGVDAFHSTRLYYWNGTNINQIYRYDDGTTTIDFADNSTSLTKVAYNSTKNVLLLCAAEYLNLDAYLFAIDLNLTEISNIGDGNSTGKTVLRDTSTVYNDSYFVGA